MRKANVDTTIRYAGMLRASVKPLLSPQKFAVSLMPWPTGLVSEREGIRRWRRGEYDAESGCRA